MVKLGPTRGLLGGAVLAWILSCGTDFQSTTGLGGAGGGQEAQEGPSAPPPLPAGLRMTALRAMQQAPGHDFSRAADGSGAHSARIGAHGASARVELADDLVRIVAPGPGAVDQDAFSLRTVHIGRFRSGAAQPVLPPVLATRTEAQDAVLVRGAVAERYLAGPLGLEQSYRLEARFEGDGPLVIEVAFVGLAPALVAGAEGVVELLDASGTTRAVYRDLAAVDATGRELAASMEVRNGTVTLVIDDDGATYPVDVDPMIVTQQGKLTATDGAAVDVFGWAVGVSGDTAIVGVPSDAIGPNRYQGSAYVFVRSGTAWTQEAKLVASDGAWGDNFGHSVTVSGSTVVVGALNDVVGGYWLQGSAYVFVRSGTTWSEQAKLTASDSEDDQFGTTVSLSGDTVLIGAGYDNVGANARQGSAYVFVRSGTTWSEEAKLTASDGAAGDYFGAYSVSLSGDTAIVGSLWSDVGGNPGQGASYVYVRSGTTWSEEAKLVANDGAADDHFGFSVSVSGDTALVGAAADETGGNWRQGSAYVFVRSGGNWVEEAKLIASDGNRVEDFGSGVSLAGDLAVVSAQRGDVGASRDQGSAYVFLRRGTSWSEEAKLTASDGVALDEFGGAVSVSESTAIVGARLADIGANADQGAAYVFLLEKGLGDPCAAGRECESDVCADGVCCDRSCDIGPCVACSVATGAPDDGTCTLLTGPVCDDGSACTQTDLCQAGSCLGGNPVVCTASNQCQDASCDPTTGSCRDLPSTDGSACSDGDACTQADSCQAGACAGSDPVVCAATDQCHEIGGCDPTTGQCRNLPKADGSACDDGDACTQTDSCAGGVCAGGNPVVCSAMDQCHEANCDTVSGVCGNAPKVNGTACDDGDGCTQTDSCEAGICTGSDVLVCTPADECHDAGACNPATGRCTNPAKLDGSACSDGDACTRTDVCMDGACAGADAVVCLASTPCHEDGICDPMTGACSAPLAPDGTPCDDGSACTLADGCRAGVCVGVPVTCEPIDECHDAGSCAPWTGTCWNPEKPDGTPCPSGTCAAGACTSAGVATTSGSPYGAAIPSEGGCGCVTGTKNAPAAGLWTLAALLALARSRRRPRCNENPRAGPAPHRRPPTTPTRPPEANNRAGEGRGFLGIASAAPPESRGTNPGATGAWASMAPGISLRGRHGRSPWAYRHPRRRREHPRRRREPVRATGTGSAEGGSAGVAGTREVPSGLQLRRDSRHSTGAVIRVLGTYLLAAGNPQQRRRLPRSLLSSDEQ